MDKTRLAAGRSRLVGIAARGLLGAAAATIAVPLAAGAAGLKAAPSPRASGGISNAVFVQTNDPAGNQILAYQRQANGTLEFAHAYGTGGRGYALAGAVVDKLASQGSLVYDSARHLLIAVNAGSDTLTSFSVSGDRLSGRHVVSAGGALPVSVTWHGDLVYVLDAGGAGHVSGFTVSGGRLWPIEHSTRPLGLTPGLTPQFLETPGQIGFTPAGNQLVVTTKANGNDIDVLNLGPSGIGHRAGGEERVGDGSAVRFRVRSSRKADRHRGRHQHTLLLRRRLRRHAHPPQLGQRRGERTLLGDGRRRLLLRGERRERHDQRLHDRRQRRPLARLGERRRRQHRPRTDRHGGVG